MPERKTARWKVIVGYVAFSLAALVVSVYLTFPYEALRARVQAEAEAAGLYVKMGSIGPGLFGVRARQVQISKRATGAEEKPPEPLIIKSVSMRPTLFPLGVAVKADALGGSVSAEVGGLREVVVRASAEELNLSEGNVKGFSGLDLSGKAGGELELVIPLAAIGGSKVKEPDLGQASGKLTLELSEVTVNGGSVEIAIPMYGPEPTPVDLPKIGLGEVNGAIKFDKGAGTIEDFTVKGKGLEVKASGTLKLAKRLEYSEPNVEVRLKTDPEFSKSLGVYGMGLSALPPDPKDSSWRLARLTGYLGRPSFR
ncbi:MAG: type II secretion system protein GspN [Myxococcales bacterium]|nr:type II secretion system protein GspN [Myxococcales bacterium]